MVSSPLFWYYKSKLFGNAFARVCFYFGVLLAQDATRGDGICAMHEVFSRMSYEIHAGDASASDKNKHVWCGMVFLEQFRKQL